MIEKRRVTLEQQVFTEIWDEMNQLSGSELESHLKQLGLDPLRLEQQYGESLQRALVQARRARFDAARKDLSSRPTQPAPNVLSFELDRKRKIHALVKSRMQDTGEMTIAARNQSIDAEQDLDSFLLSCFRLSIIDTDGNLRV